MMKNIFPQKNLMTMPSFRKNPFKTGSQLNDANWFFSQGISMTKQHGDQVRPEITYNNQVSYILSEPCAGYGGWTKPPA